MATVKLKEGSLGSKKKRKKVKSVGKKIIKENRKDVRLVVGEYFKVKINGTFYV